MAAALTLTACTSHGVTEGQDPAEVEGLDRVPNASSEHLPAADTSDVRLPTQFDQLVTVEPTWDLPVQRGGDVFLSAEETDRALVYRAVDSTGTVLWTAQRPLACAGFVVTQDSEGRNLAVLTDAETSDSSLSITTASAYDLGSGEQVWGPVEVPGPHTGPGLVFAAPPEGFMGESGESVALDPTTGEPLGDDGRVIGEFDGTVLRVEGDDVTAETGSDDAWSTPLSEIGGGASSLEAHAAASAADGLALLDTGDGTGPLLDLDSGEVLGETVHDAAHDAGAGITAFLDADGLTVRDAHGEQQLAMSVREGTTLEAVVGALVYLRDGSSVRVHNGVTGRVAQAYAQDGEGPVAVPDLVTEKGAGTLTVGGRTVLATERADEQKG
ncbi:COG1475: Predicted transcriptional regulators [Brevibacterium yomogidense]|uniref:COG1475: Predicted transcriptional regulators n=1 Tax=Brevibacterium yomogidense TaxID=946573 RepID=A0A1X6XM90_9MICO|nr:COG1475: Predicted transcriptional regulators [Brevibacterium yomogidense]